MSEYNKLQEIHKAEIQALQETCAHSELSEWCDYSFHSEWQIQQCLRCNKYVVWHHKCDWCEEWVEGSNAYEREIYCGSKGMQGNTPPYKIPSNWVICSVQCCREKRLITGIIKKWNRELLKQINRNGGSLEDCKRTVSCNIQYITREKAKKILDDRPELKAIVAQIIRKTELLKIVE